MFVGRKDEISETKIREYSLIAWKIIKYGRFIFVKWKIAMKFQFNTIGIIIVIIIVSN